MIIWRVCWKILFQFWNFWDDWYVKILSVNSEECQIIRMRYFRKKFWFDIISKSSILCYLIYLQSLLMMRCLECFNVNSTQTMNLPVFVIYFLVDPLIFRSTTAVDLRSKELDLDFHQNSACFWFSVSLGRKSRFSKIRLWRPITPRRRGWIRRSAPTPNISWRHNI